MSKPLKPWFKYSKDAGRFSAMPVSWQGWVAFLAFIAGAILASTTVLRLLAGQSIVLALLSNFAIIGGSLFLLAKIVVSKGERQE